MNDLTTLSPLLPMRDTNTEYVLKGRLLVGEKANTPGFY